MGKVVTKECVETHRVLLKDFSLSERHISYLEWDLTINFLAMYGLLIPNTFCLRCPVPHSCPPSLTVLPASLMLAA